MPAAASVVVLAEDGRGHSVGSGILYKIFKAAEYEPRRPPSLRTRPPLRQDLVQTSSLPFCQVPPGWLRRV